MKPLNFLVAPDFSPEYFTGWHFLSTRLQRLIDLPIHVILPADAKEESQHIESGEIDLFYANPFNTTEMVREKGYLPLVVPRNHPDEVVIARGLESKLAKFEDIKPGMKVLYTNNFDIKLIALRLLEAVDLNEHDLQWLLVDSFSAVARGLIDDKADFGLFISSVYHNLSEFTRSQLSPLIESNIQDLSHILLLNPRHADLHDKLQQIFSTFQDEPTGQMILNDLGLPDGFKPLSLEEQEFIIDLIETLQD